jgi:hypothetical protein
MTRLLLPFSILLASVACKNACQEICPRMAAYARDCGYEVSADEVRACVQEQAGSASRDDRKVCRQFGDRGTLREEWTCEELSDYWTRVADLPADTADSSDAP